MRQRGTCAAAIAAAIALLAPAAAVPAEQLGLREARGPGFPQRSYVLTLPEAQTLGRSQVSVRENGEPVDNMRLEALGSRSAVVLAIDASASMRGKIRDAMAAARAFAERRLPDQRLGILFFRREPTTVLAPTNDRAAIDRALATVPDLGKGTRVYDAAAAGVEMIESSRVAAGSVIVLSDGADGGSEITRNEVVAAAESAHVRLFGVGIRSPSYDSTSLQALSPRDSDYAEAASSGDLAGIYARLAEEQGREFLLTYRSHQPLEADVAVAVRVSGVADVISAAYRSPDFPVPPAVPDPPPTWWERGSATTAVVGVMGLLLAFALLMLLRPLHASVSRRIMRFSGGGSVATAEEVATAKARELLSAADGRLSKWRPWVEFELDVELARVRPTPHQIASATVLGTVALTALLFLAGSAPFALGALVGVPVTTRLLIKRRATKTRRRFEDQLPDNLQVMASALRAGHSFVAGLSVMVKDAPQPSQKEFHRVVQDEQLGVPIEKSLEVVHDRMRCEDVVYVGLLATLQRETGGNTAEVLDKVVETMRERAKLRRLVRTLTAQGRLGGWIVTALPIAMITFLNVFKPGYLQPMLDRTLGWVILIMGAMMVALGAYCIRRIVDIQV